MSVTGTRPISAVVAAAGPNMVWATRQWRYLVAPGLVALLALYALMHSPIRSLIAGLLRTDSRGCYFCLAAYPWSEIATPVTGVLLVVLSLLAAWFIADHVDTLSYERPLVFGLAALAGIGMPAAVLGEVSYVW